METFEIKLEVNGNQDDYYSMEAVDSGNEQQLVSLTSTKFIQLNLPYDSCFSLFAALAPIMASFMFIMRKLSYGMKRLLRGMLVLIVIQPFMISCLSFRRSKLVIM